MGDIPPLQYRPDLVQSGNLRETPPTAVASLDDSIVESNASLWYLHPLPAEGGLVLKSLPGLFPGLHNDSPNGCTQVFHRFSDSLTKSLDERTKKENGVLEKHMKALDQRLEQLQKGHDGYMRKAVGPVYNDTDDYDKPVYRIADEKGNHL